MPATESLVTTDDCFDGTVDCNELCKLFWVGTLCSVLIRDVTSLLIFLVGFSHVSLVIVVVLFSDVPDIVVISIAFVAGAFDIVVVAMFGGSADDVPDRCVVVFVACFLFFFFFFFGIVFVVFPSDAPVVVLGEPIDDDTRSLSSSIPSSVDVVVVSMDTKREIKDVVLVEGGAVDANEGS